MFRQLCIINKYIAPILFGAIFSICTITASYSQNKNIENKKKEEAKLQNEIIFLGKQIEQTKKKQSNSLQELNLIKKKVSTRKKLLDEISRNISEQEVEINNKTENVKSLEKELDTLSKIYLRTIYKAYVNRDRRLWYMHIFASKSVEQGYRRWSYLKNYTSSLNEKGRQIKELKSELENQKKELASLKAENEKSQRDKTKEYDQLKKEESSVNKQIQTLAKQQDKYKRELNKKKEQANRLNREIQKLIANALEAERKKGANKGTKKETTYSLTPEIVKLSSQFENNKGNLPWPVKQGSIIEGFGENPHPVIKGVKLPFNNGVNISVPNGSAVNSVFNGVVKKIIHIPGYNNCVLIAHGNYFTFYCKLGKVLVKENQSVKTGQQIANVDPSSGDLHFEIWKGTQKQNPAQWLK